MRTPHDSLPTPPSRVAPSDAMILAHLTLLHLAPWPLIEIAAAAGYDGLTLQITPPAMALGQRTYAMAPGSATLRETRQRLDDAGLVIPDVQVVRLRPDLDVRGYRSMFEAAAFLGARHVMTVSDDIDEARCTQKLDELAKEAGEFGLDVALEFMVYSGIKTIQQATRMIDATGRHNIVLMVDTLHLARSGGTATDLAATPARLIPYVQLCDAPLSMPATDTDSLRAEALQNRLFPGEGGLPLADMLAALPRDLAISVETPVQLLHGTMSDLDIARAALNASRAVVQRARERRAH